MSNEKAREQERERGREEERERGRGGEGERGRGGEGEMGRGGEGEERGRERRVSRERDILGANLFFFRPIFGKRSSRA